MAIVPTIVGEAFVQNPDGSATRIAFWELSFNDGFTPPRIDNTRIVVDGPGRYQARAAPFLPDGTPDWSRLILSPVVTQTGEIGTQASPWTATFRGGNQRYDVNVVTRAGLPVIDNMHLEFAGPIV